MKGPFSCLLCFSWLSFRRHQGLPYVEFDRLIPGTTSSTTRAPSASSALFLAVIQVGHKKHKEPQRRENTFSCLFVLFVAILPLSSGTAFHQHESAEVTGVLGVVGRTAPDLLGKLFVVPLIHGHIETVHALGPGFQPVALAAKVRATVQLSSGLPVTARDFTDNVSGAAEVILHVNDFSVLRGPPGIVFITGCSWRRLGPITEPVPHGNS